MEWKKGQWVEFPDGAKAMMCEWSDTRLVAFEDGSIILRSSVADWERAKPTASPWPEPLPEPGDVIEDVHGALWVIQKIESRGDIFCAECFPSSVDSVLCDEFDSVANLMEWFEQGWKNHGSLQDLVQRGLE